MKYVVSTKGGQSALGGPAVEGVKTINEQHGNLLAGVLDLAMADQDPAALDNPFFAQYGHDDPSPHTQNCLRTKKLMGTLATSPLDVGGISSGAAAVQNPVIWYRITDHPGRRWGPGAAAHGSQIMALPIICT